MKSPKEIAEYLLNPGNMLSNPLIEKAVDAAKFIFPNKSKNEKKIREKDLATVRSGDFGAPVKREPSFVDGQPNLNKITMGVAVWHDDIPITDETVRYISDAGFELIMCPFDEENENRDKLTEVLKYMKDDILICVSEKYQGFGETFGTNYINELHPNDFTVSDIEKYECVEDGNNRTLSFTFADAVYPQAENSLLYRNFGMSLCDDIQNAVKELLAPIATVNSAQIACIGFNISANYNATEDRLNRVSYNRCYEIKANITFGGELEELGTKDISFQFTASENHGFTYVGLSLNKDRIWLEKGERDNLTATRIYDEAILDEAGKEAATVIWSISDPDVAAIDDEGYIKAVKVSNEPVTVTAKYSFLGNEYTDTCLVYVREILEEIVMKEKEATLI